MTAYECPDHPGPLDDATGHVCRLRPVRYRFQVEGGASTEDAQIWLTCDRCDYIAVIDGPISLAELELRADEHTEVCR